ncbi:MAG: VOC family protein [Pseudomonadota bacterium]
MIKGFVPSHYLIRVDDLHAAVADYRAAGFTVTWGGDPEKAHNALIYFDSGGFLELFTLPKGPVGLAMKLAAAIGGALGSAQLKRVSGWLNASGLCAYALETPEPLATTLAFAKERGVPVTGLRKMSRAQVDGEVTRWELSACIDEHLPFMMGPYMPAPKITQADKTHPNGINRLLGLVIRTPDVDSYRRTLADLLGLPADTEGPLVSQGFRFEVEAGDTFALAAVLVPRLPQAGAQLHGLPLKAASVEGSG